MKKMTSHAAYAAADATADATAKKDMHKQMCDMIRKKIKLPEE